MVTECRCRKGLGKKGNGLDRLVVAGCSNILKTQTSNLQIFKFQISNFKSSIFNLQIFNLQSSIFNLQSAIFNLQSSNVNVSPVSGSLQLSVYRLLCFPTVASWPVALPMAPRCPRFDARAAPRPGAEGGGLWTYQCERTEDRGPNVSKFRSFEFRVSSFECLSA